MTKLIKDFSSFKYNKFNPSVNEWLNSIYNFDRNNLNMLWSNKIIFELINNYFNIKPNNISIYKKINKKLPLKRIFVSIPEIKNSLNKNDIFVYVFNKERIVINKKIVKLQKIGFNKKRANLQKIEFELSNKFLFSNLNIFPTKNISLNSLLFKNFDIFSIIKTYIKIFLNNFNWKINNEIIKILHTKFYKKYFNNKIKNEISNFTIHKRNFKNNLIKNENFNIIMNNNLTRMRKIIKIKYYILFFYKRYITRLYFNKLKFNCINLFNLNKIFHKIYNKRININIINLKYLHLDYSLFINAIVRKLKKRKTKVLRVLRKALILPKIPKLDSMFLLRKKNQFNDVIYNLINFKNINIKNINKIIFKSIKNIHIIGVRLEGKGRLTRRLTAARAVYKKTYIGNLRNVYSSSKGFSALMSKGFYGSNLNYINSNSYNRNGSYGIKSWHNTM